MGPVIRIVFRSGIRVLAHGVERQRIHSLRIGRVGVGILSPAIDQKQKIAPPSLRKGR